MFQVARKQQFGRHVLISSGSIGSSPMSNCHVPHLGGGDILLFEPVMYNEAVAFPLER